MLNNKKGFMPAAIVVALCAFGAVTAVALWHVPAWSRAKAAHCEAEYQAGNMTCGDAKK